MLACKIRVVKMISIVVFLLASGLIGITSAQNIPPPINALQVFALPVGQGDCTIIQCPNGNIVVFDCGSSGGNGMTAAEVANWLGNSGINRVVAILVTHANRDHYNYLPPIPWNTTSTRAVIIGGAIGSYPAGTIRNWLNGWASLGKLFTVGTAQSSPSFCIGNCVVNTDTNFCGNQNIQFNILATNVGSTANQQSIVMKITVAGQWSMLLSGDMEGDASLEIANQLDAGLQSIVYKMSHHGASASANMIGWLTPIAPQFAFASSGYNFGRCRHPRCDTINRLLGLNTITMTTPHQFYCGNPGGNPSIDNAFRFNMLETSPNATHICLLTYVSTNTQPQSDCFLPTVQSQLTDDMDVDDDCDDSTAVTTGGAGFCIATSSFVFAAAALLCVII